MAYAALIFVLVLASLEVGKSIQVSRGTEIKWVVWVFGLMCANIMVSVRLPPSWLAPAYPMMAILSGLSGSGEGVGGCCWRAMSGLNSVVVGEVNRKMISPMMKIDIALIRISGFER